MRSTLSPTNRTGGRALEFAELITENSPFAVNKLKRCLSSPLTTDEHDGALYLALAETEAGTNGLVVLLAGRGFYARFDLPSDVAADPALSRAGRLMTMRRHPWGGLVNEHRL